MKKIRIQLAGGDVQDVDTKMLPDGAVTAVRNYYYDKSMSLARRRSYTVAGTSSNRPPLSCYSRGTDRVVVESSLSVGVVSHVGAATTLVEEHRNLSPVAAIERDPFPAVTSPTGHRHVDITYAGGYMQMHHTDDTIPDRYIYSGNRFLRVWQSGTSLRADLYHVSSTCPDGVNMGTIGLFAVGSVTDSVDNSFDACTVRDLLGDNWMVAYSANHTHGIIAYRNSWATCTDPDAPSTAFLSTAPYTPRVYCGAGGYDHNHRGAIAYLTADGGGTAYVWRQPGPSGWVSTVYEQEAGMPSLSPPYAMGNGFQESLFVYSLAGDSNAPGAVQIARIPESTDIVEVADVPGITYPTTRPRGWVITSQTSFVALAGMVRDYTTGVRHGVLMAGPTYDALRPVAQYGANALHFEQQFLPALDDDEDPIGNGLTWAGKEYTAATNPILGYAYRARMGASETLQPMQVGGDWYYSGALVQHDGGEAGFLTAPDLMTLGTSAHTSNVGTERLYSYRAVYEWTAENGKREQSQPTIAKTVTCPATHRVTIKVPPPLTRKKGVTARIYRDSQLGGVLHHAVALASFGDGQTNYTTVYDSQNDSTTAVGEILYADQGKRDRVSPQVSENTALWSHGNRLWCADGNRARYSDETRATELAAFPDTGYVEFPSAVIAFASMGDTLVVLCSGGVYLLAGEGPTDDGAGPWATPYVVPGARGCSRQWGGQRSVAVCSVGIVYRSQYGIELLAGGAGGVVPQNISGPVADLLDSCPFVTSAVDDPDLECLRFLIGGSPGTTSNYGPDRFGAGHVLVWEYGASARTERPTWHTESLPGGDTDQGSTYWPGRTACMWGQDYAVGARHYEGDYYDARWLQQHDGSDTGFVASIQLGRIRPGEGAGNGRIKTAVVLGEQTGRTGSLRVTFDFDSGDTRAVTVDAAATSGEFVAHITSPRQRCHHATLKLSEDQSAGTASPGVSWNSVTVEVDPLPGARRLPRTRRF
jgi:hypothetical protein